MNANKIDFNVRGRMMSGSKSGYLDAHPNNVAIFNANILTKNKGKIWYGDLDLTRDLGEVRRLAAELNEPVFVLREHDARFQTDANPNFDSAVVHVLPNGDVGIKDGAPYEFRDGTLQRKQKVA